MDSERKRGYIASPIRQPTDQSGEMRGFVMSHSYERSPNTLAP
jgi:hypothetical protein